MNTLTIKTPTISAERILESSGGSESCLLIKSAYTSFRAPQQITIMLKGLIFNAMVSVDVWTAEISPIQQPSTKLAESDYTVIADLSDFDNCGRLTINAISVGNNIGITLTLAAQSANQVLHGELASGLGAISKFLNNPFTENALAEKGHAWVAHSTRNLAPKPGKKNLYRSAGCKVIPSDTVLNLRALVGAFDRLSTQQIEKGVQELIDLLDYRSSDPDLEVDVDFEPENEEESDQLI